MRLAELLRTTGKALLCSLCPIRNLLLPGNCGGGLGRKDFRQGAEESPLMAGGIAFCNGTNRRNKEVLLAPVGARHPPTFSLPPKRRRRRRRQLKRAWSHHVDTMLIEAGDS